MRIKHITIDIIPHTAQRYDTQGDYYVENDTLKLFISEFENPDIEIGIMMHELYEAYTTDKAGIKEEDITKFDTESKLEDPGRSKDAPYHKEHMQAERLERLTAKLLGWKWKYYYNTEPK